MVYAGCCRDDLNGRNIALGHNGQFCVQCNFTHHLLRSSPILHPSPIPILQACKFTTEGTIALSVSKSDQHGKPPTLLLTVTDTGKGIPEEKRGQAALSMCQQGFGVYSHAAFFSDRRLIQAICSAAIKCGWIRPRWCTA